MKPKQKDAGDSGVSTINERTCSKCGETKPLGEFKRQKKGKYGRTAKCKECYKAYYRENKDSILATNKAWYESNKKRVLERQQIYKKHKRATDPDYLLACRMRCRLHDALGGRQKNTTTQKLVGCTWGELKDHIESQFTEGMSWDNRDQWEVDHIVPINVFVTDGRGADHPDCWHYTNLRPLWTRDNRIRPKDGSDL